MEFCLLGSRLINPKQRLEFSNTEMKLKSQKYCENSKKMAFFLGCVLCISPYVLNVCLAKAKNLVLNKYTKVGKRSFSLNREANYRPQGAFDGRAEEGISVVMFAFLSYFSLGFLLLFIAQ